MEFRSLQLKRAIHRRLSAISDREALQSQHARQQATTTYIDRMTNEHHHHHRPTLGTSILADECPDIWQSPFTSQSSTSPFVGNNLSQRQHQHCSMMFTSSPNNEYHPDISAASGGNTCSITSASPSMLTLPYNLESPIANNTLPKMQKRGSAIFDSL